MREIRMLRSIRTAASRSLLRNRRGGRPGPEFGVGVAEATASASDRVARFPCARYR